MNRLEDPSNQSCSGTREPEIHSPRAVVDPELFRNHGKMSQKISVCRQSRRQEVAVDPDVYCKKSYGIGTDIGC